MLCHAIGYLCPRGRHTDNTYTHTHTDTRTKAISRNQACAFATHTWFKNSGMAALDYGPVVSGNLTCCFPLEMCMLK